MVRRSMPHSNTRTALTELGLQADIEKVTDFADIASCGS
jgi:hypothetical protein